MAKIYEFPKQYGVKDEIEDCLYEIGKAYVKTLNYALTVLSSDDPGNEELNEINKWILVKYEDGLNRAIAELYEE